jgi:hypothetical protein
MIATNIRERHEPGEPSLKSRPAAGAWWRPVQPGFSLAEHHKQEATQEDQSPKVQLD